MKVKPYHLRSHGSKPKKPYAIKDELKRKNMELVIENMKLKKMLKEALR